MIKKSFLITCALLWLSACAVPYSTAEPASPDQAADGFVLTLIRHAEKTKAASDPELTEYGLARSAFLTQWMSDRNLDSIWSSDYQRTRQTVGPLALAQNLEISIYNPRDLQTLADTLLSKQHNAIVSGHSNTTPELAALLCSCEVTPMNESDYERFFEIYVTAAGVTLVEQDMKTLWLDRR